MIKMPNVNRASDQDVQQSQDKSTTRFTRFTWMTGHTSKKVPTAEMTLHDENTCGCYQLSLVD